MFEYEFDNVVRTIKDTKFYIFGTGSVSKRFCYIIKKMNCWKNVKGFIVSQKMNKEYLADGKYVWNIDQVSKNEIILIAVHKAILEEVEEKLYESHFSKMIWIYPYLHDLFFGFPVQVNVRLDTRKIVQNLYGIYAHTIYYIAIEGKVRKNDIGKILYIKYMKIFSSEETALKRWESFEKRIDIYEKKGFINDYNIKLTEDHRIILDGAHRLMLAYYFRNPLIFADIYKSNLEEYLDFSGEIALTENQLTKYFSPEEVNLIIKTSLNLNK